MFGINIPADVRRYIYVGTAFAMAVMLALGVLTPEQLNGGVDSAVKLLGALAAVLAAMNIQEP